MISSVFFIEKRAVISIFFAKIIKSPKQSVKSKTFLYLCTLIKRKAENGKRKAENGGKCKMQNRRTKQEQRMLAYYALQEGGKALEEGLMQNAKWRIGAAKWRITPVIPSKHQRCAPSNAQ